MSNKRKQDAGYSEETLKLINSTWMKYKQDSGSNQKKSAKALDMNQSAFSQYLRGDIPLNTDFINKFANLTSTDPSEFGLKVGAPELGVSSYTLNIEYTLSGDKASREKVAVESVIPVSNYGVLIDVPDHWAPEGSVMIVDRRADIRNGDLVMVAMSKNRARPGYMKYSGGAWKVLAPTWGKNVEIELKKSYQIDRVTSIYLPEGSGKVYEK